MVGLGAVFLFCSGRHVCFFVCRPNLDSEAFSALASDRAYAAQQLTSPSHLRPSLQVYEFMEPVLESLHDRAHGDEYVNEDETSEHPLGFAQVRPRNVRLIILSHPPGEVSFSDTSSVV